MRSDVLIIGAGVVGCGLARVLSRYDLKVEVVERGADVSEGPSKANSGIVHAGFDAVPGTLKAKLNVEGAKMYPALCKEVGAPYGQPGALVLAFREEDRATIQKLYDQGIANDVPGLEIIEREQILALEPNVNPDVVCALHAKTSGLTSPYELTYALADHAAVNGVVFHIETEVHDIDKDEEGFVVHTSKGDMLTRCVVNCAGVNSAEIHNQITDRDDYKIIYRRGEYYLMDRMAQLPFTSTMFQCPTKMGKGVLISPTVHGNLLLGPSAEDIDDKYDVATTRKGLDAVMEKCRLTWPSASPRGTITNFSGIRSHEQNGDFVIGPVKGVDMAFEAIGIESPGLSAAPAIAEMLGGQIVEALKAEKKATYLPAPVRPKPFYAMTNEERAEAVKADPQNGALVCRCEVVTEAEIRACIRRPVGARNIDAVKRRTRAGMGRCQGGFCSPRVLEILSEELGIPFTEVTKCGGESKLLVGRIGETGKGEN